MERTLTKPLTKRAKEMLLNIAERRSYRARWSNTRWVTPKSMGGASRRLLEALEKGGYLRISPYIHLTEAGMATAMAYRQHLIRINHPTVMEGFRAIGTTGPLKDEEGNHLGGRCVVFVKTDPPSTRE
jgi:hypothetical protein